MKFIHSTLFLLIIISCINENIVFYFNNDIIYSTIQRQRDYTSYIFYHDSEKKSTFKVYRLYEQQICDDYGECIGIKNAIDSIFVFPENFDLGILNYLDNYSNNEWHLKVKLQKIDTLSFKGRQVLKSHFLFVDSIYTTGELYNIHKSYDVYWTENENLIAISHIYKTREWLSDVDSFKSIQRDGYQGLLKK